MAFCYSAFGESGLRYLLENIDPKGLERDVEELEAVGLPHVAAIVAEVADALPESALCPHPEGTANFRDWHRRHQNRFSGYLHTPDSN